MKWNNFKFINVLKVYLNRQVISILNENQTATPRSLVQLSRCLQQLNDGHVQAGEASKNIWILTDCRQLYLSKPACSSYILHSSSHFYLKQWHVIPLLTGKCEEETIHCAHSPVRCGHEQQVEPEHLDLIKPDKKTPSVGCQLAFCYNLALRK